MRNRNEIMKRAVGIDYDLFEEKNISFDYERMMREVGYSLDEIRTIQTDSGVGNTPLLELKNITALARRFSPREKEPASLSRMKRQTLQEALKHAGRRSPCTTRRSSGLQGLLPPPAATTGRRWQVRLPCTVLHALLCRNVMTRMERGSLRL